MNLELTWIYTLDLVILKLWDFYDFIFVKGMKFEYGIGYWDIGSSLVGRFDFSMLYLSIYLFIYLCFCII
jgi:hypothetical protein